MNETAPRCGGSAGGKKGQWASWLGLGRMGWGFEETLSGVPLALSLTCNQAGGRGLVLNAKVPTHTDSGTCQACPLQLGSQ